MTRRGDKPFAFLVDGRTYTDRAEAAPPFAAAIQRGVEAMWAVRDAQPGPSAPIARYRGFEVIVRPASVGTIRLGLRCPERSNALEYVTTRTLDVDQVSAYGTGLFQRLDHVLEALDAELKAARDGLAREETNLASYSEQLARPFEHDQALLAAQRELARIERKLTGGGSLLAESPGCSAAIDDAAA